MTNVFISEERGRRTRFRGKDMMREAEIERFEDVPCLSLKVEEVTAH